VKIATIKGKNEPSLSFLSFRYSLSDDDDPQRIIQRLVFVPLVAILGVHLAYKDFLGEVWSSKCRDAYDFELSNMNLRLNGL